MSPVDDGGGRFDVVDGRPDFDTVYTRCPTCGVVAAAGSADYPLTAGGDADLSGEIRLTCAPAGHRYTVTSAAFFARDAVRTCARPGCGTTFACPAEADEVVCPTCRLYQPGPFLHADDRRRDYVRRVHHDYLDDVRARLHRPYGDPQ
ncbi:hypothetical protein [Polymorphospora sp. NPDC050346]|uniref:hypothetical protein n=1 Tax=Polymorphospora sp. NPDC050346 TaxID=3155780 RepID=UPI0033F9BEC0